MQSQSSDRSNYGYNSLKSWFDANILIVNFEKQYTIHSQSKKFSDKNVESN